MTTERHIKKNSKNSDSKTPDDFAPCFEGITRDLGLTKGAIFGYLWRKAQGSGYSYVSQETMERDLRISQKTIKRGIQELIDLNLLLELDTTIVRRPKFVDPRTNSYIPNDKLYREKYTTQESKNVESECTKLTQDDIDDLFSKKDGSQITSGW